MKRLLLLALLLSLTSIAAYGQDCSGAAALQKHIYKPDRLVEQKPCITVRGIIRKKLKEGDGDFHVRLELDAVQPNGLNPNDLLNACERPARILQETSRLNTLGQKSS